ncbi:MAG TPA: hypothetical protein VJC14_03605, partial [Candidatus Paceibacterota bacterium]
FGRRSGSGACTCSGSGACSSPVRAATARARRRARRHGDGNVYHRRRADWRLTVLALPVASGDSRQSNKNAHHPNYLCHDTLPFPAPAWRSFCAAMARDPKTCCQSPKIFPSIVSDYDINVKETIDSPYTPCY